MVPSWLKDTHTKTYSHPLFRVHCDPNSTESCLWPGCLFAVLSQPARSHSLVFDLHIVQVKLSKLFSLLHLRGFIVSLSKVSLSWYSNQICWHICASYSVFLCAHIYIYISTSQSKDTMTWIALYHLCKNWIKVVSSQKARCFQHRQGRKWALHQNISSLLFFILFSESGLGQDNTINAHQVGRRNWSIYLQRETKVLLKAMLALLVSGSAEGLASRESSEFVWTN